MKIVNKINLSPFSEGKNMFNYPETGSQPKNKKIKASRYLSLLLFVFTALNTSICFSEINIISPILSPWSNWSNIGGDYPTAQAVCDARNEKFYDYEEVTFIPHEIPTSGSDGVCKITINGEITNSPGIAYPFYGYFCPDGYSVKNITDITQGARFKGEEAYCYRAYTDIQKNVGYNKICADLTGNPINTSTGNKHQLEIDYGQTDGLQFARSYNSSHSGIRVEFFPIDSEYLIPFWFTIYDQRVYLNGNQTYTTAQVIRGDGKVYYFNQSGNSWLSDADIHDTLERRFDINGTTPTDWRYTTEDDTVEIYDVDGKLTSITDTKGNTQVLTYIGNLLNKVTTNTSESLTFTYDTSNRISTMTDHTTRQWRYAYDANNNLQYVSYPDDTGGVAGSNPFGEDNLYKEYHYNEPAQTAGIDLPNALTGITDERGIRYATYEYDTSGRATATYHGLQTATLTDRLDGVTIDYEPVGYPADMRVVTNSNGEPSFYTTAVQLGVALVTDISGPGCASCGNGNSSYEYDPMNNNLLRKTDNDMITRYGNYDTLGNPSCMVEGINFYDTTDFTLTPCGFDPVASPNAKRTDYTYIGSANDNTKAWRFRAKLRAKTEPSIISGNDKTTFYDYDIYSNIILLDIVGYKPDGSPADRRTTMQYNGPLNQISQIDGPRTDVSDITTFEYYPLEHATQSYRAKLKQVAGPDGTLLRSNIIYTTTGKVQTEQRPNGLSLNYVYYPGNDRLDTLTETANGTSRTTHWTYLATGEVETITTGHGTADATTLSFVYDAARRLTYIFDGNGHYIEYTLDTEGNLLTERTWDNNATPGNAIDDVLTNTLKQTFDTYNRLNLRHDYSLTTANQDYTFNPDGSLQTLTDGEGSTTTYGYDDLKRLTTNTHDFGTPADNTDDLLTQYGYDTQGNLTSVTDPNNNETTYQYDDLGNLITQTSIDTGTTHYTYDNAGNLKTKTDANDQLFTYYYDQYNRLINIQAGAFEDDIFYIWDTCTNGFGKLCKASRGNVSVAYHYNSFGDITHHQGIDYTYDEAGRQQTMTYPSGAKVIYSYDAAANITDITLSVNGFNQILASQIGHLPFGPVNTLTYGNGKTLNITYNNGYQSASEIVTDVLNWSYPQYDNNSNMKQRIRDGVTDNFTFDKQNQLDTTNGGIGNHDYNFDNNGNLTTRTDNGTPITFTYEPNTNRLDSLFIDPATLDVIHDNNGNITTFNDWTFTHGPFNRILTASQSASLKAIYTYNALGQRIKKQTSATTNHYLYGLNGELLAEIDSEGNVLYEHITLNGQPLALYLPDSDNNGTPNAEEPSPFINVDDDGDGLTNLDEWYIYGTDHQNSDTDGDGINDGVEITNNTNPLSISNYPGDGDINEDGIVNLGDLVLLRQFVLGTRTPNDDTKNETIHADINRDGEINLPDMIKLQNYILDPVNNPLALLETETMLASFDSLSKGKVPLFEKEGLGEILKTVLNTLIPPAHAALTIPGKLYFVHNDHLGTPVKLTDDTGTVVWSATYAPFGKAEVNEDPDGDTNTITYNIRFPGQYYDSETGLHYNYYRYYDPNTGRYMTSDPIGILMDFSSPQRQIEAEVGVAIPKDGTRYSLNHLYGYVDQNPVNRTDPTGELGGVCALWPWGTAFCIAAGIGTTIGVTQCVDKSSNACEKNFPNWKNDPIHNRGYLKCMASLVGGAGSFAGAFTDPHGTISTTVGTEVGKKINNVNNRK